MKQTNRNIKIFLEHKLILIQIQHQIKIETKDHLTNFIHLNLKIMHLNYRVRQFHLKVKIKRNLLFIVNYIMIRIKES